MAAMEGDTDADPESLTLSGTSTLLHTPPPLSWSWQRLPTRCLLPAWCSSTLPPLSSPEIPLKPLSDQLQNLKALPLVSGVLCALAPVCLRPPIPGSLVLPLLQPPRSLCCSFSDTLSPVPRERVHFLSLGLQCSPTALPRLLHSLPKCPCSAVLL